MRTGIGWVMGREIGRAITRRMGQETEQEIKKEPGTVSETGEGMGPETGARCPMFANHQAAQPMAGT
jgi:hypothetical protein